MSRTFESPWPYLNAGKREKTIKCFRYQLQNLQISLTLVYIVCILLTPLLTDIPPASSRQEGLKHTGQNRKLQQQSHTHTYINAHTHTHTPTTLPLMYWQAEWPVGAPWRFCVCMCVWGAGGAAEGSSWSVMGLLIACECYSESGMANRFNTATLNRL